jgi:hypothetical protein
MSSKSSAEIAAAVAAAEATTAATRNRVDISTIRLTNGFRELTLILMVLVPLLAYVDALVDVRGPLSWFSTPIWTNVMDILWNVQELADFVASLLFFVSTTVAHDMYRGRMKTNRAITFWVLGIVSIMFFLIGAIQEGMAIIWTCGYYGKGICACDPAVYLSATLVSGSGWCLSTAWAGYVRVEFIAAFALRLFIVVLQLVWLEFFRAEVWATGEYWSFYNNAVVIASSKRHGS